MMQLQKIDTNVLISMINAFSAYYGREYTPQELFDSTETIKLIKLELETRKLDITASVFQRQNPAAEFDGGLNILS